MKSFIDFSGFISKKIKVRGKEGVVLGVIVKTVKETTNFHITFILKTLGECEVGHKVTRITADLETIQNGEISIIG